MSRFVSRVVGSFHFEIENGIGSFGLDSTRISRILISTPFGARSSARATPSASIVIASRSPLLSKFVFPCSNTHCSSPSLFRSTTKDTSPMSRIAWTAPFTFTVLPS